MNKFFLLFNKRPIFFAFQGRRSSGSSGVLNTQYLRKALAEVANLQNDFNCDVIDFNSDVTDVVSDDAKKSNSLKKIPE